MKKFGFLGHGARDSVNSGNFSPRTQRCTFLSFSFSNYIYLNSSLLIFSYREVYFIKLNKICLTFIQSQTRTLILSLSWDAFRTIMTTSVFRIEFYPLCKLQSSSNQIERWWATKKYRYVKVLQLRWTFFHGLWKYLNINRKSGLLDCVPLGSGLISGNIYLESFFQRMHPIV